MRSFRNWVPILLSLFLLSLLACSLSNPTPTATGTPTLTPRPSPTPTATPPPTATPTPTPTPTPVPTATPTATPVPTATPTAIPTPSPTPTATPVPTATPTPTPTPVVSLPPLGLEGGKLTTVALADFPHQDVHQTVSETLAALGPGIVYSRLLRLRTGPQDVFPQPSLLLECDLCESWEVVETRPLTYRFQLRQGVKWQNVPPVNGRELVAEDLVYSWGRQRTEDFDNRSLLQNMASVEAEGKYTLRVTLDREIADADFLVALADGHTKVVAREAVELKGDLIGGPTIGSGPWIWDRERSDEGVGSVFVKNPGYFEAGLPLLDEFVILIIKTGLEVQRAMFVTDQLDVYRVAPEAWDRLVASGVPFNSFESSQAGAGLVLTMNVSAPPFDDPEVRKAVLRALDPWDYVDKIWAGQGFVSAGVPVQRPDWLLTREEMRPDYFADPADARDRLAKLGLALPIGFQLTVGDFGNLYLEQSSRLEADLRSVGFNPNVVTVKSSQYSDQVLRGRDYQMALGVIPPVTTTNSFLIPLIHGAPGRRNIVAHDDAILKEMIGRQAVERDPGKRRELVREVQRYLLDQAYLFSPVTGSVGVGTRWASSPRIRGFYPNTAASEYFYWAKTWREP